MDYSKNYLFKAPKPINIKQSMHYNIFQIDFYFWGVVRVRKPIVYCLWVWHVFNWISCNLQSLTKKPIKKRGIPHLHPQFLKISLNQVIAMELKAILIAIIIVLNCTGNLGKYKVTYLGIWIQYWKCFEQH